MSGGIRRHGKIASEEEVDAAMWAAARGAMTGAAKYGLLSGLLGTAAYYYSPVYRGLTIQFKVFLQLSGMALGGMIEGDNRMREYEQYQRRQKRLQRDAAVWRRYEAEYEAKGTPGVASEGRARNETLQNDQVSSYVR